MQEHNCQLLLCHSAEMVAALQCALQLCPSFVASQLLCRLHSAAYLFGHMSYTLYLKLEPLAQWAEQQTMALKQPIIHMCYHCLH